MTLLEKATEILSMAYGGLHHVPGKIRDKGSFVECNVYGDLSTYDNTILTRLVIGAHDQCCRLELGPSGTWRVKLRFSDRIRPEECGDLPIARGHVTIEEAVEVYRNGDRYDQFFKPTEKVCTTSKQATWSDRVGRVQWKCLECGWRGCSPVWDCVSFDPVCHSFAVCPSCKGEVEKQNNCDDLLSLPDNNGPTPRDIEAVINRRIQDLTEDE
jgi:hypothetical protein